MPNLSLNLQDYCQTASWQISSNLVSFHGIQINIQQQPMQKSDLFGLNSSQRANTMLYSRIQPQHNQRRFQNQYITHKIPKVDKKNFENYQVRAGIAHPNVARIFIQQKSQFYHSIYIEKSRQFGIKDLLMLPINKRIMVLAEILSAVKILATVYGFFYITEKMLGYSSAGKIIVWIHENIIENKRSHPINHGKLSQDIFVSDFKAGFGGNLRQLRQFQRVKKIDDLISLLSKNSSVAHSVYLSEPAHKESHIHRRNSQLAVSDMDDRESFNIRKETSRNQFKFSRNNGLKKTESLNTLRSPISFSYLPNQLEKSLIGSSKIMPSRALAASVSMQSLHLRQPQHQNRLNTSNSSLNFSKMLRNSSSLKCFSKSIQPKIQFTYQKVDLKDGWKKKPNTFSKMDAISPQNMMMKSQSVKNLGLQTQQYHKQPLKVSFPHTTNHTFAPFASNGNISLAFKESANLQRKGIKLIKQDQIDAESQAEQHISEDSNEVEMDLDILFSDDEELHSREEAQQLEMIMEEFENVLLS